jgi:hypothetical protein
MPTDRGELEEMIDELAGQARDAWERFGHTRMRVLVYWTKFIPDNPHYDVMASAYLRTMKNQWEAQDPISTRAVATYGETERAVREVFMKPPSAGLFQQAQTRPVWLLRWALELYNRRVRGTGDVDIRFEMEGGGRGGRPRKRKTSRRKKAR